MATEEEIAEAFNRLFELELGWSTNLEGGRIKITDLQEFIRLCEFITERLQDKTLQQAI